MEDPPGTALLRAEAKSTPPAPSIATVGESQLATPTSGISRAPGT
jgi:hypothetical protein